MLITAVHAFDKVPASYSTAPQIIIANQVLRAYFELPEPQ